MARSDPAEARIMSAYPLKDAPFLHKGAGIADVAKGVIIQAECVGGQIAIGTEFTVLIYTPHGGFAPEPDEVYPAKSVVRAMIRFNKKSPDVTFGAIVEFDSAENAARIGPGWSLG